jgi:hypothetical protein
MWLFKAALIVPHAAPRLTPARQAASIEPCRFKS